MFKVYLTNFGYFADGEYDMLRFAIARAKAICFECTIYKDGEVVGEWSPIGGYRPFVW